MGAKSLLQSRNTPRACIYADPPQLATCLYLCRPSPIDKPRACISADHPQSTSHVPVSLQTLPNRQAKMKVLPWPLQKWTAVWKCVTMISGSIAVKSGITLSLLLLLIFRDSPTTRKYLPDRGGFHRLLHRAVCDHESVEAQLLCMWDYACGEESAYLWKK